MDWREFFESYGECPTTNGNPSATLEQIYQAFKERLISELWVTPSAGYGYLEDKK